jgi:hypothetical protein
MFIYVDEVDATVDDLRIDTTVLREPADMPWGERVAYVADPDGNPVALAASAAPAQREWVSETAAGGSTHELCDDRWWIG